MIWQCIARVLSLALGRDQGRTHDRSSIPKEACTMIKSLLVENYCIGQKTGELNAILLHNLNFNSEMI